MKQIIVRKITLVLLMLVSYTYYVWLRAQHGLRIHAPRTSFGDTPDYLRLASESLFARSFWIASRPPVLPLFLRLLNSDPQRIFKAQLWLSIISWGILALIVALAVRSWLLKLSAFIIVLGFSLGQNIIMWDPLVLSDSLALSLLALFLAASVWLLLEWRLYKFLIFALVATLLVFVRDTYAYLILMAGVAVLIVMVMSTQRRRFLAISALFITLFLLNNAQATAGGRWVMPFYMSMGLRILPNPDYLEYFQSNGMPVNDALLERSGKPGHADGLAFLKDPRLEEFRIWTLAHGRSVYIRYLWFFKADVLQAPFRNIDLLFNPDPYYYTPTGYRPIIKDARISELLYPSRFALLAFWISQLIAAALLFPAVRHRQLLWIVPLMLVLFSYPQAVLIWSADANDIARHAIYHNIEQRLGLWLMILFVSDFLILQIKAGTWIMQISDTLRSGIFHREPVR